MTSYTAKFETPNRFAVRRFEANTPKEALQQACALNESDPFDLDWEDYDFEPDVERIIISNEAHERLAIWDTEERQLQRTAADVLEALEQALIAIRTGPMFHVPKLYADSYKIAARCEAVLKKAKGGIEP